MGRWRAALDRMVRQLALDESAWPEESAGEPAAAEGAEGDVTAEDRASLDHVLRRAAQARAAEEDLGG